MSKPSQTFALNITTIPDNYDKYPPQYAEYIVEKDGNYYITLNGIKQSNYDLQCMQGDIIQIHITHDEVITDIKKQNEQIEKHNKEYLEDFRFVIKEYKPLTKTQESIYLLIHFLLLIIIPIILLEEFIKNPIINIVIYLIYIACSSYISLIIQKYITNKIFKLIYNA